MAGLIDDIQTSIESHDRRLDRLEKLAARKERETDTVTGALGKGVVPHVPVREEFLVEVGLATGGGIWNARRLMLDGSNTWVYDDEDTDTYVCWAGPGCAPFIGCRCWARLEHLKTDDTPVYILTGGEAQGFEATLDDAVDGAFKYAWTQIDALVGTTALTHATGSLGRAFNRASAAYNANFTDRKAIPVGTRVALRWNASTNRMEFTYYPEPNSEAC